MTSKEATLAAADVDTVTVEDSASSVPGIVLELNAMCRVTTLKFTLSVGELVVRRLYDGDLTRFRSRKPKDDVALRRVATHPALAMHASVLYTCVATYEVCERIGVHSWKHVSTSHIRVVLPLPPDTQVQLLRSVEANRWPVKRLEQEVEASQHERQRRGGRPRHSPLVRAIHLLDRDVRAFANVLEDKATSSPEQRSDALTALRSIMEVCRECEKQLDCKV